MTRLAVLIALVLAPWPAQAQTPSSATAITLEQLEQLALQNNPTGTAAAAGIDAALLGGAVLHWRDASKSLFVAGRSAVTAAPRASCTKCFGLRSSATMRATALS